MAVGAQGRLTGLDTANHGDFRRDLHRRQNATLAGFGALTQLYLEHAHLLVGGDVTQTFFAQMTFRITHAVLGGTNLEDDVGAAFEMIRRQTALTGIHPHAGQARALGQGQHRRPRDRAVAHTGDIEHGTGVIGRAAIGTDGHAARLRGVFLQGRVSGVDEDHGTDGAQIARRAKRDRAIDTLGRAIDPRALGAIEGHLFAIHGEKILTEEFAQRLEHIAQTADHGIVAPYRVGGLRHVDDVKHRNGGGGEAQTDDEQRGETVDDGD